MRSGCGGTDESLRREVGEALARHKGEIDAILAEYGVPRVDAAATTIGAAP